MTLKELVNVVNREERIANKKWYIAKLESRSKGRAKRIKEAYDNWQEKRNVAVSLSVILENQYWDLIEDDK